MKRITNTLGIGVDVIKISRFDSMLNKKNRGLDSEFASRLSGRILHQTHELPAFNELVSQSNHERSLRFLAGAWATKEAIYKTLNEEDQKAFQFKHWFKTYNERGKPEIASDNYPHTNEEFLLSISHDHDVLVASVIRQEVAYVK